MKNKLIFSIKQLIKRNALYRRFKNQKRLDHYLKTIAPNSDIKKALIDENSKKAFIKKCSEKWPEELNSYLNSAYSLYPAVSSTELNEMLFCFFSYGFSAAEFISYELLHKSESERLSYISDRDLMILVYMMNDYYDMAIYNNKCNTYLLFKQFYKRDAIIVNKTTRFSDFKNFINYHTEIVLKPAFEAMGRGIKLIQTKDIIGSSESFFTKLINEGEFLVEEKIIQDSKMAVFNDSSVNTIRIITFNTQDGIISPYCFIKVGRRGAFVDNGGAGGIMASVDIKTGRISSYGVDETGNTYSFHPDSKKAFLEFELPEFDQAIALCKLLASKTPEVRFIGWDLAYRSDGWILVEGNAMSQLIGPQSTQHRGIKNEIRTILCHSDLIIRGTL